MPQSSSLPSIHIRPFLGLLIIISSLLLVVGVVNCKISPIGPPISRLKDSWSTTTPKNSDSIKVQIDLYVDLACSDSAEWWTSVFKSLDSYYFSNSSSSAPIKLNLHLLPLPYHISSYATSMSYIAINKYTNYNSKVLKELINSFYTNQSPLYNNIVSEMKQSEMYKLIYTNNIQSLNVISWNDYLNLMLDGSIDMRTRTLFKLSTANGVFATPSFYVNGVAIQNGENFTFNDWVSLFNNVIVNN
ncbi:predicted protein [Naegleria gruberi]|uniref:Predicted protein n=1 Tax=Naegleria gruberi TaxID=5762 RepID=D2VV54_NAEGR|nr:uncharacterized protein NAEGRDRAFT_72896 [Naegleria gruberi]EFC39177.1 predicted protein [Naegleria gruberi]|eukprot:XP_002671921.1 predicted protein [Naegleria gruberi strain NEG-M]